MIEWNPYRANFAFYANDQHTKIGYLYLDKTSRRPILWRFRLEIQNQPYYTVLRIEKPPKKIMYTIGNIQFDQMRAMMHDLAVVARNFNVVPRGQQKSIQYNSVGDKLKTDMLGQHVGPVHD